MATPGPIRSGGTAAGRYGQPSKITAYILETTVAAGIADRDAALALLGSFVDISEPNGDSWTNALIVDVSARVTAGHRNLNGTSYPVCVECILTILAQE